MQEALRFRRSPAEPVSEPDFVEQARLLRRTADASRALERLTLSWHPAFRKH